MLSAEKRTTLFSNIPLILDLNAKFLQQLDARISKWEQSSCIGDLFVQFARTFPLLPLPLPCVVLSLTCRLIDHSLLPMQPFSRCTGEFAVLH